MKTIGTLFFSRLGSLGRLPLRTAHFRFTMAASVADSNTENKLFTIVDDQDQKTKAAEIEYEINGIKYVCIGIFVLHIVSNMIFSVLTQD